MAYTHEQLHETHNTISKRRASAVHLWVGGEISPIAVRYGAESTNSNVEASEYLAFLGSLGIWHQ